MSESGHFLPNRARHGRGASRALAGMLLLLGAGGAGAGSVVLPNGTSTVSVPTESMKEARFRTVVKQQYDFSCGSAAVATLLSYHYEDRVSELEVFKAMYRRGNRARIRKEGFSMLDMKKYLAARGYRADGFRVPLDKLKQVGVPAIVLTNDKGYSHFVVVKGLEDSEVLIGDPAKGLRRVPREEFEDTWNGLVFVVRGRSQVARNYFNRHSEWAVLPGAPLDAGVQRRRGLADFTLNLPRRGDF